MDIVTGIKTAIDVSPGVYIQPTPDRNETTLKLLNKRVSENDRLDLPANAGTIQAALNSLPAQIQKNILHDEIMNDPAQAAANQTIATQLNTLQVEISVTTVSWQQVISAIGGATIAGLNQLKTDQLELIKSDNINPQDAEFIAAVLGITGVDISSLATKSVPWPESKGWRKVRAGEVGMARNLT